MANFGGIKISRKQRQLQNKFGFTGRTRELSRSKDCFEYLQKFPTKPSYPPKKTCQNFPTQKKSSNREFKTPNNPSIIPVS